jgi:high affinity sulfate transporter 1
MRRLADSLPILRWLKGYQRPWLRLDLVAGTTLAAYAVPNAVAYALLAGLPPVAGLAGYLFGGLIYAALGTSRLLAFGPTSAISLVVATTLAPLAGGDAHRYAALAGASALLVGALALAGWAMRWGGIAHFISHPVLTGYKFGAAVVIAATQLPDLLGIPSGGHDTFSRVLHLVRHLTEARPWVLGVGLCSLLLLELGQRFLPQLPMGLLVVLLSMGAAAYAGLEGLVPVVGNVPLGLPHLALPLVNLRDIRTLLPLALACFLLAYLEGMATARAFSVGIEERVDANQELLALGAANLMLGVGQGYPAGGGLGQSAVNARAGARTPLSLVVASGWMAVILLYLVGVFGHLPRATLAALVVASVSSLLNVSELVRLARVSPIAIAVAGASIAGVVYLGILQGVLLAALLSLAVILRDEASTGVSELGAVGDHYADKERHPTAQCRPGTMVLRINGPLLYFNTESVEERMLTRIAAAPPGLSRLVLDLSFTMRVDVSGGDLLKRLKQELLARGITLFLADAHHPARVDLARQGLDDLLVDGTRRLTVAETLELLDQRAPVAPAC